jgi:hypothetical protein
MIVYRIRVDVGSGTREQNKLWFTRCEAVRDVAEMELSYAGNSIRSAVITEHADDDVAHLDGFYHMTHAQIATVLDRYMAHVPGRESIQTALAKRGIHIHLVVDRIVGDQLRDALVDDLESLEIGVLTEVIALKLMEPEHA